MYYFITFAILSVFMYFYLRLAEKAGIIDQPNERSSHKSPTIRGGGIIFPVSLLIWGILFDHSAWLMIFSVLLIGIIGFMDDRYSLHQMPRLTAQSISVFVLLYFLGVSEFSIVAMIVSFILITGWLNTFNFMDGINGITPLYAISVLVGTYLFRESIPEVPLSLYFVLMIALAIFGFLNTRKKAVVFAGDVGSLSLGFILAYFVASLIIETGRWEFILFLSVYGVDSVITIIHRLLKKENIFEAHRTHLYQFLANEIGFPHRVVSLVYAFLQLVIIYGLYEINSYCWPYYSFAILTLLIGLYTLARNWAIKKIDSFR